MIARHWMQALRRPGAPTMKCTAPPPAGDHCRGPCQARKIAARLPRRAWQRYPAGAGAKGHRFYNWAWLAIDPGQPGSMATC